MTDTAAAVVDQCVTAPSEKRPLMAAVFLVLAILAPVSQLTIHVAPALSEVIPITIVILMISAFRLASLVYTGTPRLLMMTTWMFIYITAAVTPIAHLVTGLFPYAVDTSYLTDASKMFLTAAICFELGGIAEAATRREQRHRRERRAISHKKLRLVSAGALAATAYYIFRVGGVDEFFLSRTDLRETISQVGLSSGGSQVVAGVVTTLGTVPVFVCLLYWLISLSRGGCSRVEGLVWIAILAIGNLVNNPFASPRYWIVTMGISVLFAFPGNCRRRVRAAVVFGLLAALIVFPHSDYAFRVDEQYRDDLQSQSVMETIATKDFDQWVMASNGASWVSSNGHTAGRQLLSSFLFWVPRSIWPEKGMDTGVEIGTAMGLSNTNLSAPLPLELWVDFGYPGVVVGFLAIGFAAGRLDGVFSITRLARRRRVLVIDAAVPLLAGYMFILMRGSLLQSMGRLAVMVALLVILGSRSDQGLDGARSPRPTPSRGVFGTAGSPLG